MAKKKSTEEGTVLNIHRKTRKQYSAGEKIRIVLEGLRRESTVAELCRRDWYYLSTVLDDYSRYIIP